MVRFLIDAGSNLEATDQFDATPLLWAAAEGHAGVATALIAAGADPSAEHCDGSTALHIAASRGPLPVRVGGVQSSRSRAQPPVVDAIHAACGQPPPFCPSHSTPQDTRSWLRS